MSDADLFLVYDRLKDTIEIIGDLSIAILNDETNKITDKQLRRILTLLRQYRDLLERIIKAGSKERKEAQK